MTWLISLRNLLTYVEARCTSSLCSLNGAVIQTGSRISRAWVAKRWYIFDFGLWWGHSSGERCQKCSCMLTVGLISKVRRIPCAHYSPIEEDSDPSLKTESIYYDGASENEILFVFNPPSLEVIHIGDVVELDPKHFGEAADSL